MIISDSRRHTLAFTVSILVEINDEIINSEKIAFKGILEFCAREKLENIRDTTDIEKERIVGFQNGKNENTIMAR